jgi:hypothetical protein
MLQHMRDTVEKVGRGAGALLALQPAGYRHLALEISPPMATVLDGLAREGLPKVASSTRSWS